MSHFPPPRDVLVTTAITATTSAVVSLLSRRATGSAAAGLNATSHIRWGKEAGRVDQVDFKHTFAGTALNAAAMLAWSTVHHSLPRPKSAWAAVAQGVLVSTTPSIARNNASRPLLAVVTSMPA